nr:pre-mrna-splicing factor cwc24 [Quercus suber]
MAGCLGQSRCGAFNRSEERKTKTRGTPRSGSRGDNKERTASGATREMGVVLRKKEPDWRWWQSRKGGGGEGWTWWKRRELGDGLVDAVNMSPDASTTDANSNHISRGKPNPREDARAHRANTRSHLELTKVLSATAAPATMTSVVPRNISHHERQHVHLPASTTTRPFPIAHPAMADVAPPTFKKRVNKNIRKRLATPPPATSDSPSDYTTDDDENEPGVRVKRRRTEGLQTTRPTVQTPQDLSKSTKFAADASTTIAVTDDATRTTHWDDETARPTTTTNNNLTEPSNGTYRGTSTYGTFITRSRDAAPRPVGPVRGAASNVRQITVTDFAPDVCKDYKQTGFCGFGDSCKFLHAREDYKQGWQLDKEWESAGVPGKDKKPPSKDKQQQDEQDEEEKLLASIPFKCIICREAYTRPVRTRCGHYFCEKCAMTRYMKEKKKACANCGADTNGTFNAARKLSELLERKRRRVEEAKLRGEEVDEDGEATAGGGQVEVKSRNHDGDVKKG